MRIIKLTLQLLSGALCVLLFSFSIACAAVVLEESVTTGGSGNVFTLTSIQGGTDQSYVLFANVESGSTSLGSVSGGGLTWTQQVSQCADKNILRAYIWTAQGSPGSSFQTLVDLSGNKTKKASFLLVRYSGVSAFEGATGANEFGVGGNCSSESVGEPFLPLTSTEDNSEFIVGVGLKERNINSVTAGFSLVTSRTVSPVKAFLYAKTVASAGVETFNASLNEDDHWAAAGIVLNSASADGTAPAAITDLATSTVTSSSIQLTWTAPGDDDTIGTATAYDIRYSTSPIDDSNWGSATQVSGEPAPQIAGSSESFTVIGLSSGTSYYFAIKTEDEVPNISQLSNVASGTTSVSLDHLRIEHTGIGLTCQRSEVTIRACEDASCTTEYIGSVSVILSPSGQWIGGDNQTISGGSATFQLRQNTPATVTLGISSPSPTPANSSVCYLAGSPGSCNMAFYEAGFIFTVPDLTACRTSSAVSIQAVRADATAQTCIADGGFASANKTVNFWSTYVNPATGTEQVSLGGTNVSTSNPGTGITLNFDASATANFTVNYPDVGQMQLDARYDGVGVEEAGLVMLGNDSFIVRPVGLCVYSDDANADCAAGNGSCSVFKRVDEAFNLKVKGVCWESPGDTDYCSGNSTTQNFQLSSIPITHNLIAPSSAGVSAGNLGVSSIDISAADNGEHIISNQTVSEVGVYTFTATPPNYLGGALPVATSINVGRFTPDHFVTSITDNGVFQDACTGFTYSGQEFSYVPPNFPEMLITATGSAGNTTVNYRDDFVKLTNPATQISMPAVTADSSHTGALANPLALTWVPAASNLIHNDDGTLDFTLGTDQFTYTREPNALVAPFASDIQLSVTSISDSDGVSATGLPSLFLPTGTEIRYGQMQLQNAYGPETLPLTIPVLTEYYNGSGFVLNSLDNCSAYDSLNLTLSNFQGNLVSGDTTASGSGTLLSGLGNSLSLSAPGVGHDGSADLTLDLSQATGSDMEWLQPGGVNPTAKATFGIFNGNQRLIYMRESVW